ncbi:MAG TPA: hypothetical protein VM032_10375 [Vicinamibacterales bacterium]|nr:hypothetical protein [Vicinamibacterales bacterium]
MTRMMPGQCRASGRALSSAVLAVMIVLACDAACGAQARSAQAPARQRPLEGFTCSRDNLTSYTGVVVEYRRVVGETTLRIRTDWDTTERVTVKHPGTDDPSAFFRVGGRPFNPRSDWKVVEQRKGVLVPGARVAAWVCGDGKVMLDWGAPKE